MTEKDTLQDKRIADDNEAIIQEMVRDAEDTKVHSELDEKVLHKGDAELEAPMTIKELTSAGYKSICDTRTVRWVPVLSYMLTQKLRERRDDGSYRWRADDPHREPIMGRQKCMLHKDSPNRAEYDELGLVTCKKSNIKNKFEVKQHMEKKHPKEWKTIEDGRKEMERQEDRALQRELYKVVGGKKEEKAPLYVSDKDKKLNK